MDGTTLAQDLARDYGLVVAELRPHPGGFDTECFTANGVWFIKLWRGSEQPARLGLLGELSAAGLPVPVPLATQAGELHAWSGRRPYAVFEFVIGRTAQDEDWPQTAQALKLVHALSEIDLPNGSMDEPEIWRLGEHLDHPWIEGRRREVAASIQRLQRVIERAEANAVPRVVCHRDLHGLNLLVEDGQITAILDWEQAVIAPREHDLWVAAESKHGEELLTADGARDLDLDHLEYVLLARALRDMAARVLSEMDRSGVETWGFRRIAKLDRDLEMYRPFCK